MGKTSILLKQSHSTTDNTYFETSRSKKILVVEDDSTHRALIEGILKGCGFETSYAENGVIALSKIAGGEEFDLILMDWDMPELNGLQTTRALRCREIEYGYMHTPIIAFTAHAQPGDREKCIAAGMDAYLPKDVWMPHWRQTLIDNLEGLFSGTLRIQDFERYDRHVENNRKIKDQSFNPDLFDTKIFQEARDILKGGFLETIEDYLEDAASYIREIKLGVENHDYQKIRAGSHPLKSNSKGLGLISVSKIAEAINQLAQESAANTPFNAFLPLVKNLDTAFEKAEKRIKEIIKADD